MFDAEPPGQIERARKFLSGLSDCKVEFNETTNTLRVSYSLRHCTPDALEIGLAEAGFHLDHSPLHSIARQITYTCEDTICHNLNIPAYPTRQNEREVFIKAYEHEPHGGHDDTPPELRDYR